MMTLSLRTRLTLWYTFALVVVLCLFGADVLWVQGRLGIRRVDRELDGLETTIANVVRGELKEHSTPASAAEEARDTVATPGRAVAILDVNGSPLASRLGRLDLRDLVPLAPLATLKPAAWTVQTMAGAWR